MDDVKEIFKLLKNHLWKDFLKAIEDPNIDLNIRDEQNNYIIQYIILYNKPEILELVLQKNINLDVKDLDGYGILHLPIKLGYNDILKILLSYQSINVPLLDIVDKYGNTPIFYTVLYNNYDALDIILKYAKNINIKNKNKDTLLHIAITNLNMIKKLLEYKIDVNTKNLNGYTPMHLACINKNIEIIDFLIPIVNINIKENNYELIPIMYILESKYIELIKKMLKYGVNVSEQDIRGDSVLHHAIRDGYIDVVNLLIDKYHDMNLINIDGMTILHLCAFKYTNIQYPFREMIIKTNLNIQDNKGNTCMYYLVINDIWVNYIKELEKKEIDIYIKNIDKISIFDINKSDKLITLIAKCHINNNKTNKSLDEIKKLILAKKIKLIKGEDDIILDKISIIKNNTFIGIPLDIICGCLLLTDRDKIVTSINNSDLRKCEILWNYHELIINDNIIQQINNFKKIVNNFLVILLGIELPQGAHSNILLYDKKNKSIERFEPHGKHNPSYFYYNSDLLDKLLEQNLKNILPGVEYISPTKYLPKIGFQSYESNQPRIGGPEGYCVAWCLWYARQRCKYPDIPRQILITKLFVTIKKKTLFLKDIISSFAKEITNYRDILLNNNNITLNNVLNNNYDIKFIDKYIIKLSNFEYTE